MKNVFVHPTSIIDENVSLGSETKIWHFCHVSSGAIIGENCILGQNVFIGKSVTIGNRVKIQNNVSVYEGVTLGDDVFCGPSVVFTNVTNPRANIERKDQFKTTPVDKGATIGANATIVCGCEIGQFSFVGAGSVVTKSVKPFALVVGNPARQIGWVNHLGEKLDISPSGKEIITCETTGFVYKLKDGLLSASTR